MSNEKKLLDTLYPEQVLFFTGAGLSAASGIPTFRGEDGYWNINGSNYTPEAMASRAMYETNTLEFLKWYYHRFAKYSECEPNAGHKFIENEGYCVINQNIDGLLSCEPSKQVDIHGNGRLFTLYQDGNYNQPVLPTLGNLWDKVDPENLELSLIEVFKLSEKGFAISGQSYKPHVLLFDEYYTDKFGLVRAQAMLSNQKLKLVVAVGTTFKVGIAQTIADTARYNQIPILVVDPDPDEIVKTLREDFGLFGDMIFRFKGTFLDFLES